MTLCLGPFDVFTKIKQVTSFHTLLKSKKKHVCTSYANTYLFKKLGIYKFKNIFTYRNFNNVTYSC